MNMLNSMTTKVTSNISLKVTSSMVLLEAERENKMRSQRRTNFFHKSLTTDQSIILGTHKNQIYFVIS